MDFKTLLAGKNVTFKTTSSNENINIVQERAAAFCWLLKMLY